MNPLRWLVAQSTQRGYSEIDCFIAGFRAFDGVAALRTLVLDTPNVIASGEGNIDFARETLDLRIRPSAKHKRMVEFAIPFAIKGNLANPSFQASTTGGPRARWRGSSSVRSISWVHCCRSSTTVAEIATTPA